MLNLHQLIKELLTRLASAISNGNVHATDTLLSITLTLPEWSWNTLVANMGDYCYSHCPQLELTVIGCGSVLEVTAQGTQRLHTVQQRFTKLKSTWPHWNIDANGLQPRALLAFAFDADSAMNAPWDSFPNTLLQIPAVLLQDYRQTKGITCSCRIKEGKINIDDVNLWTQILNMLADGEPGSKPHSHTHHNKHNALTRVASNPTNSSWLTLAEQANADIQNQKLTKVVLTRHIQVQGQHQFIPINVMKLLAHRYPNCTQIAISRSGSTLIAATPERLVTLQSGRVTCEAVAGTAPYLEGTSDQDQTSLELLGSAKGQHEHRVVVQHITDIMQLLCSDLIVQKEPKVMTLRFMHHLHSILSGKIKQDKDIFDFLQLLHPTPAVGGTPTPAAIGWIRRHEKFERGWYTGVLGWLTSDGEGEFSVILRCALLRANQANLFAGAGLVTDSEPVSELAETEIKLQTILDVLQDV